jgi:hypothetical protein
MLGISGRTREIAQYAEVPLAQALKIHNYIDDWLDFDWSEATRQQIEATIDLAIELLKKGN